MAETVKLRRFDFSPDEYISGVGAVLGPYEQAVYWMVCSLIMSHGGPVEEDHGRLSRLCMMRPSHVKRVLDKLVSVAKLHRTRNELDNKRARSEIEAAANRVRTAHENGVKGGRPPKEINGVEKPGGLLSPKPNRKANHQPSTTIEEERDSSLRSESAPDGKKGTDDGRAKRGTRLPVDWEPGRDGEAFAANLGLDPVAFLGEFRDYWNAIPGSKGCKLDWDGTWRNRCREIGRRKAHAGPARQEAPSFLAALRDLDPDRYHG